MVARYFFQCLICYDFFNLLTYFLFKNLPVKGLTDVNQCNIFMFTLMITTINYQVLTLHKDFSFFFYTFFQTPLGEKVSIYDDNYNDKRSTKVVVSISEMSVNGIIKNQIDSNQI